MPQATSLHTTLLFTQMLRVTSEYSESSDRKRIFDDNLILDYFLLRQLYRLRIQGTFLATRLYWSTQDLSMVQSPSSRQKKFGIESGAY